MNPEPQIDYAPWCPELAARLVSEGRLSRYVELDDEGVPGELTWFESSDLDYLYRSPKCWGCDGPLVIDCMQRIRWTPFCEWWCVPVSLDEEKMLSALASFCCLPVGDDLSLIRDRLYGGFLCRVGENCRHVALDISTYNYADPAANRALSDAERDVVWERLTRANRWRRPRIGDGPFCRISSDDAVTLKAA
ncbi:MAG: hypothetical protein RIC55_02320 [Pirellulaceae bacterium]